MNRFEPADLLTFVAFAVFFACCVLQFPVFGAVRRVLEKKHPTVLRDLKPAGLALFGIGAMHWFAVLNRDANFSDPELTAACRRARLLTWVAYGSWGFLLVTRIF